MKKFIFIDKVVFFIFLILYFPLGFSAPVRHRVHPPRNTEKYAEEAERTRLEVISSRLELTETQKYELKKLTDKRIQTINRIKEKEEKIRERFDRDMQKYKTEENKAYRNYMTSVEKILNSSQYRGYLDMMQEMGFDEFISDEDNSETEIIQPITPDGKVGEIVKAPFPPVMYNHNNVTR